MRCKNQKILVYLACFILGHTFTLKVAEELGISDFTAPGKKTLLFNIILEDCKTNKLC